MGYEDFQALVEPDAIDWLKHSYERMPKQWLDPSKERLDPTTFAVILLKLQYIARVMWDVMAMSSRSSCLNVALDFCTGILDRNVNTLIVPDFSLPGFTTWVNLGLLPVVDAYEGDIKPGDLFINNSYYEGCAHIPEINVYCPVFYNDELLFWTSNRPHHNDIGCYLPTGMNVWAKDIYEEGLHLPPYRIARNWKLDEHFANLLYRNIRYPKVFRGDHLAVIESVWAGEKKLIELIEKYKADTIKQWQDEWQDCGDRRTAEEIRKLPKGTWYFEGTSDSYPFAPKGLTVRAKMTIDPDEAKIHYDLTESDDQVEGGINCCPAMALVGATTGTLFCLDPTLPRNQGSYNHVTVELRKGSAFWVTFPHTATACTTIIRDHLCNGIMETFAEIDPKRGHAACGYEGTSDAYFAGVDPKRNEPYQLIPFVALSGGCASYGYDGWPGFVHCSSGGAEPSTPVEVHELRYPHLIRENYFPKDSGGYGQWIGAPGGRWTVEPIGHDMMVSSFGDGIEHAADGVLGGGDGMRGWHRIVDPKTREHIATLGHKSFYTVKQGQMWEGGVQGGGGFGDPLDRDPEKVRWDTREERISLRAAREVYGVILNTEPEQYEVDCEATRKLREEMKKIPLEERKKRNDQIMMERRAEDGIPPPTTERGRD